LARENDGVLREIASFGDISGASKKKINGCNCFKSDCHGQERVVKWSIDLSILITKLMMMRFVPFLTYVFVVKKRGEIVSEKREILFNWSIICMYLYYFIFEGWFIFSFKFKNYIDLGYEL